MPEEVATGGEGSRGGGRTGLNAVSFLLPLYASVLGGRGVRWDCGNEGVLVRGGGGKQRVKPDCVH